MNRNTLYVLVFVALCAVAGYFVWQNNKGATVVAEQNFATKDTEDIVKIFLVDKMGNRISLAKVDDHWMVNGKFKAMQAKVDVLLSTLKSLQVDIPVPISARENVIKDLAVNAVKVELYIGDTDNPKKVFYVGSAALNHYGNYMIMQLNGKTADNPYLVGIPGFIGDLYVRFFTDEVAWRDTNVFDFELDEIAEVLVSYPNNMAASFNLAVVERDSFLLTGLLAEADAAYANQALYVPGVNKFLNSFSFLNVEAYENNYVYKDSILGNGPIAIIAVTPKQGAVRKITFYAMPASKRTKLQFDARGNEISIDPDRYYVTFNKDADFAIAQDFVFNKVLRQRSDFYIVK